MALGRRTSLLQCRHRWSRGRASLGGQSRSHRTEGSPPQNLSSPTWPPHAPQTHTASSPLRSASDVTRAVSQTGLSSQIRAGDVGSTTRLRAHECASFVRLHRDSGPWGNDGGRAPRSRGRHGRVWRFASRGGALQPGLCLSSSPQASDMRGHEDLTSTDPLAGPDRARSRSLRRRRRVSPDWDV